MEDYYDGYHHGGDGIFGLLIALAFVFLTFCMVIGAGVIVKFIIVNFLNID